MTRPEPCRISSSRFNDASMAIVSPRLESRPSRPGEFNHRLGVGWRQLLPRRSASSIVHPRRAGFEKRRPCAALGNIHPHQAGLPRRDSPIESLRETPRRREAGYSPLPITLSADAAIRAATSGSKPSCGYARTGTERRRSVSRSAILDLSRKRHGRSITDSESRCGSRGRRSKRRNARFPIPESGINSAVGQTTSLCKARLSRPRPRPAAVASATADCRADRLPGAPGLGATLASAVLAVPRWHPSHLPGRSRPIPGRSPELRTDRQPNPRQIRSRSGSALAALLL